jgi:glutathione synthase/RimK-type ligase-like ATP-grasp enzyme
MKKIGVMVGRERSFPDAFIAEVNRRSASTGVSAEYVRVGSANCGTAPDFAVILDRISHEVPFYQAWLKHAALQGVHVVNNPFWKLADDKFFGTALAEKLGVPVPRTVALPNREYIADITPDSLRNLEFVNWEAVLQYTGTPAFIKPLYGGGWKSVAKVTSVQELLRAYNASGQLSMIVQEGIQWSAYVRCIVIGCEHVYPHLWDPSKPHHERYTAAQFEISDALMAKIVDLSKKLCQALGYEMNTVEFAIRDGVPYAIDFMNAAPDLDRASLTQEAFDWATKTMSDYLIPLVGKERKPVPQWDKLLFQP